jgi:acyl-CoA synthetase (AMP-forming)/AMP-acid ligase II
MFRSHTTLRAGQVSPAGLLSDDRVRNMDRIKSAFLILFYAAFLATTFVVVVSTVLTSH